MVEAVPGLAEEEEANRAYRERDLRAQDQDLRSPEAPPFRTSFTNDFDRRQFQRNVLYDAFREELGRLLERRASNLSFDQKDEIENLQIRRFRKEVGNRRLKGLRLGAPDPEWHVETFEKIASIEWLKFPPARDDHAIFGDIEHLRR